MKLISHIDCINSRCCIGWLAITLNLPFTIQSKSWCNAYTMTDKSHTRLRQKPAFMLVVSAYLMAVLPFTIMVAIMSL